MQIVLIRHASREFDSNREDKDQPLSITGRQETEELKKDLQHLGVHPQIYLTSSSLHAIQMGELLADAPNSEVPVRTVKLEALAPKHEPGNIQEIEEEAINQHGIHLKKN